MRNEETYKTMKEIADILGVSKPTLFRFLKANSFHETVDEMLVESLKEQIKKLHALLDQQQQLLLYEQQKNTKFLEENIENKR